MRESDRLRFARLCHEELMRAKQRDGIGLLAEKRLHSALKRFVCDDFSCHEKKVPTRSGKSRRFVADVRTPEGDIYEIQTGNVYSLRQKIAFYMEETDDHVTLVHPLTAKKWVSWMDPETGEVSARNHSPLRETPLSFLGDLRPYLPYLGTPRFSVLLPCVELDEYRLRNGWGHDGKRGSHRYELIPLSLIDLWHFSKKEEYLALFPTDLTDPFTARDFAKNTGLRGFAIYDALAVFEGLGAIQKNGKRGRAALYQKTDILS